jgi:broad specificity phosphatase PhoE
MARLTQWRQAAIPLSFSALFSTPASSALISKHDTPRGAVHGQSRSRSSWTLPVVTHQACYSRAVMPIACSAVAPARACNVSSRRSCVESHHSRQSASRASGCRVVTCSLPSVSSPKTVTLVRHGQSTWNEEGRIQGSSDFSVLTRKGEAQAERTRQMLDGESFDVGFRSPLRRASRTAEVIWGARNGAALVDLWVLREIDLYSMQGLRKQEGKSKLGVQYAAWKAAPADFEIDGHFPVRELWERGAECWQEVLRGEGKDVLVVAHNAVIQAMTANALGLSPEYFRRLEQSNCGVTQFAFDTGGRVELLKLNQTDSPPVLGNLDDATKRGVFICTTSDEAGDTKNEATASQVAAVLRDVTVARALHDGHPASVALATEVCAAVGGDAPNAISSENIHDVLGDRTFTVFASASTIASFTARALGTDAGFASKLRLTRGGITVVEFQNQTTDARVACVNYAAHLGVS